MKGRNHRDAFASSSRRILSIVILLATLGLASLCWFVFPVPYRYPSEQVQQLPRNLVLTQQSITEALRRDQDNADLWLLLISTYEELGQHELSRETLRHVRTLLAPPTQGAGLRADVAIPQPQDGETAPPPPDLAKWLTILQLEAVAEMRSNQGKLTPEARQLLGTILFHDRNNIATWELYLRGLVHEGNGNQAQAVLAYLVLRSDIPASLEQAYRDMIQSAMRDSADN